MTADPPPRSVLVLRVVGVLVTLLLIGLAAAGLVEGLLQPRG